MKKALSIIIAAIIIMSMSVICASAADTGSAVVYVTVTDSTGAIVVAAESISVTDTDGDGALTVSDALYAAHEKFYAGGAAAGYETSVTQWGLGIQKMWGTANGGSYGYYVNNASAWSLTDPVTDGDYVAAFVYTDPVGWSDNYSYFDRFMAEADAAEGLTLTYSQAGYDEAWNPVTLPVEGAVITVDGKATAFTTDSQGKVTVKFDGNGSHIVSATVEGKNLVSPVCIVNVTGAPEATEAPAGSQATPDESDTNKAAVNTGFDASVVYIMLCGMMLAFAAAMILRKRYEK